eukprot:11219649-Lingulodinium_polyedra.AAC.1
MAGAGAGGLEGAEDLPPWTVPLGTKRQAGEQGGGPKQGGGSRAKGKEDILLQLVPLVSQLAL